MRLTTLLIPIVIASAAAASTDVTCLLSTPSLLSSERDNFTCTGSGCEHVVVVKCRRDHTSWQCDTFHRKFVTVFKPAVTCTTINASGVVSCGVEIRAESPSAGETILHFLLLILFSIMFGPAFIVGLLFTSMGSEYVSTNYEDC